MTYLFTILFLVSFALNIILVWYIRKLISQLYLFTDEVFKLEEHFDAFGKHLGGIYELEMFYGDDTLDGLIRHSKDLLSTVSQFRQSFSLEEEEEDGARQTEE
tara:strand:- start:385 stop:693 length:309 start_codon:yes stop_codon:yes gene_type:complete